MCLITKNQKQIAAEDINVYKVLSPELDTLYYGKFKYELGKLYETDILRSWDYTWADIISYDYFQNLDRACDNPFSEGFISYGQGFHSIRTIERVEQHINGISDEFRVFKCIIPKGAEYIIDETGLVISNKIIVVEVEELENNQA